MFQPANEYPVRTIVPAFARVVFAAVPFAIVGAGIVLLAVVWPFPSYVIVEFHCAYRVTFPVEAYVPDPVVYPESPYVLARLSSTF